MTTSTTSTTSTTQNNPYAFLNNNTSTTTGNAASSAASIAAASSAMSLGQADFLKLMTTQMTHQDPNNPMTNGDFLSQMAQFGTVSGIQGLQSSFATFASSIQSEQASQATGLIGHEVSVTGTQGILAAGGNVTGNVNLASSATDVTVAVTDSTGALVKTLDLGAQSAGKIPFTWDGTNTAGTMLSPGTYKIQAAAMVNVTSAAQTTNINSTVQSVTMPNGTTNMQVNLVGGNSVDFSQVQQIL